MADIILSKKENSILEITLNNPDKMNCMGFEMLRALDAKVKEAAIDPETRVLLLKGAGERAFSTGADLKEFQSLPEEKEDEWIACGNEVFNRVEQLPIPTVALINGYAVGGGLELALACDFRLGMESAVLASVEVQHGWLPGWGGMARLRRLIGEPKAKEVVLMCEKIKAERALEMGLLTRIIGKSGQEDELDQFLDHLVKLDQGTYRLAKYALMDAGRTTSGPDVQFDILAVKHANRKAD